jgi:hypothetical protein
MRRILPPVPHAYFSRTGEEPGPRPSGQGPRTDGPASPSPAGPHAGSGTPSVDVSIDRMSFSRAGSAPGQGQHGSDLLALAVRGNCDMDPRNSGSERFRERVILPDWPQCLALGKGQRKEANGLIWPPGKSTFPPRSNAPFISPRIVFSIQECLGLGCRQAVGAEPPSVSRSLIRP